MPREFTSNWRKKDTVPKIFRRSSISCASNRMAEICGHSLQIRAQMPIPGTAKRLILNQRFPATAVTNLDSTGRRR
jgi:hypothetical protein